MKIMYRFLIILFTLIIFSGCTSPIGTVDTRRTGDLLWAVPNRQIYNMENPGEDRFDRVMDLQVFTSFRGTVETVSIDEVDIFIVEDPLAEDPEFFPVSGNRNGIRNGNGNGGRNVNGNGNDNGNGNGEAGIYLFEATGRKVVIINYLDMETYYSIEVFGTNRVNRPGSGIHIQWF